MEVQVHRHRSEAITNGGAFELKSMDLVSNAIVKRPGVPEMKRMLKGPALFVTAAMALHTSPAWSQMDVQNAIVASTPKTPEVLDRRLRRILASGERTFSMLGLTWNLPWGTFGAVTVSAKVGVPISAYVSDVAEIERIVGGDKQYVFFFMSSCLVQLGIASTLRRGRGSSPSSERSWASSRSGSAGDGCRGRPRTGGRAVRTKAHETRAIGRGSW